MKRGPEIKLPKLRVPKVLADIYRDLDERHLLPLVLVLIVAIIAVPIAISGSSSSEESGAGSSGGAVARAGGGKPTTLVVAKEAAALRNYHSRLGHLHKKDPFRPRFTAQESGEGGSSSEGESESGGEGESESGGGETETTTESKTTLTFYSIAIDVRITPLADANGTPSKAKPYVRHNLPPLTMLPSRETPALTYMGPSRDGRKALMVVSSHVTSLFGDSPCIIGSATCQLLGLEGEIPETVVWGENGRTYSFELLKMHLVASDKLNRAGFGQPKKKHG